MKCLTVRMVLLLIFMAFGFNINESSAASPKNDANTQALKEISHFAEEFCSIPREGKVQSMGISGTGEAGLKKLISKLIDLRIGVAGKYNTTEWEGILQKDLSGLYAKKLDCKKEVLRILKDKLLTPSAQFKAATTTNSKPYLSSEASTSVRIGDVTNNTNTQVNVNSPNSLQIVNNTNVSRVVKRQVKLSQERLDDVYVTQIVLEQTKGIWDQGALFKFAVKLSAPYLDWHFVKGMPMARMNIFNNDDPEKGIIYYQMGSAPLHGDIVAVIRSKSKISIEALVVEPTEESIGLDLQK